MVTFEEVLDKLKVILSEELGKKRVFDKDVANALGINHLSFATLKRRKKLPLPQILDFCAKRRISINWLLYDQSTKSIQSPTERLIDVRYFGDVYASAGGGAFNYEEEYEKIVLDEHTINRIGGVENIKEIDAINVLGDSMEPTLCDGDIIFINKNIKDISKSGIFAVSTPVGLFVKRVIQKSDGSIELISDNKRYANEIVGAEDIEVLGKVVGAIRSF